MTLDKQRIVEEAVALLDDDGLDGLTLRKLAKRLDVQAPTLYWHVPNTAALITAVADVILDQGFGDMAPPAPGERWQDWLTEVAIRLRRALLDHRDSARVISFAQLSRRMTAISELAMSSLVDCGVPLRDARIIVLTVERFTVGHVLEEQAPRPDAESVDMTAYASAYPTVIAAVTEYFKPGRTVDDLFEDCLATILDR